MSPLDPGGYWVFYPVSLWRSPLKKVLKRGQVVAFWVNPLYSTPEEMRGFPYGVMSHVILPECKYPTDSPGFYLGGIGEVRLGGATASPALVLRDQFLTYSSFFVVHVATDSVNLG